MISFSNRLISFPPWNQQLAPEKYGVGMLISFWDPAYFQGLHPGRLTWNLQFTQLRKENDLPNLHEDMFHVNLWGCLLVSGSAFSSFFSSIFFFPRSPRIRISPSGPSNPQLTVEYRVPWAKFRARHICGFIFEKEPKVQVDWRL